MDNRNPKSRFYEHSLVGDVISYPTSLMQASLFSRIVLIGHFTVVCLVTSPCIRSEAGGDLASYKPHCFSYVNAN